MAYAAHHPVLPIPIPTVLMYIDDSNMFESTRKYSGSACRKGFRDGVPDIPCRIKHRKMISIARAKRELLLCKLYTSQEKNLALGNYVDVKRYKRSQYTNKEKQVDTALTADAVEDMILQKYRAGPDRTLILFSGDKDLTPVVNKAIDHGYKVELWSFDGPLNKEMKWRASENPHIIKVFEMEKIFDKITFMDDTWKEKQFPKENSLVASIPVATPAFNWQRKPFFKHFINKSSNIFKLPMFGKYLDSDENDNPNYERILLIVPVKPRQPILCDNCQSNTTRVISYLDDAYQYMPDVEYYFTNYQLKMQTYRDFRAQPYTSPSDNLALQNRFQLLNEDADTDNDDDDEEQEENEGKTERIDQHQYTNNNVNAVTRNVDVFNSHYPYYGAVRSNNNIDIEVEEEDPSTNGWTERRSNMNEKPKNMYTVPCRNGKWCSRVKCTFSHTEEELRFFRRQKVGALRKIYKTVECRHFNNGFCQNQDLCVFAHGPDDFLCISCRDQNLGCHLIKFCPLKQN